MTTELVLIVVSFVAGAVATTFRRKKEPTEPTCVGYRGVSNVRVIGKKEYNEMVMFECKAIRSPLCSDGRCSFHCREMCKCDVRP